MNNLFFLFFSIPFLLIRLLQIKEIKTSPINLLLSFSQDIFLSFQIFLLFFIPHSFFFSLSILISTKIYLLFDAYLSSKLSIRMKKTFLLHWRIPIPLLHSAQKLGAVPFVLMAIFIAFYDVSFFYFFKNYYSNYYFLNFSYYLLAIGILSSTISFLTIYFWKNKFSYIRDNIVIREEFSFFNKKIKYKTNCTFSKNEIYQSTTEKFPLLRFTKGFSGKKLFHVDFSKNEFPNIIFLIMESFRAKNVGCLNGKLPASYNFDKLSKEGILFSNFYSNSILTHMALVSSLFGIPYHPLGSYNKLPNIPLIGIPKILKKYGYQTSFLFNGSITYENMAKFFKTNGWDNLIDKHIIQKDFTSEKTIWGHHDESLMRYTVEYLKKAKKPIFATIETISNHYPWETPSSYPKNNTYKKIKEPYSKYLETFHYSDYALKLFIDLLRKNKLNKNLLLFIFADHGQPMGEHHENYLSNKYLYEEGIHVPFLILADGKIETPCIIDQLGSHVDLLPTLLDILNLNGWNHSIGESLVRKTENKKVYLNNPYHKNFIGIREGNYKYIFNLFDKKKRLYDLKKDSSEHLNIINTHKKIANKMHKDSENYFNFFENLYKNKKFSPGLPTTFHKKLQKGLTNKQLKKFLKKHPNQLFLNLNNCLKLTSDGFSAISQNCQDLLKLNLKNCLTTDKDLFKIATKCLNLTSINIDSCLLLTDLGIKAILKNCTKLETLKAYRTKLKLNIKNQKFNLTKLFALDCKLIDDNTLSYWEKMFPNLTSLKIDCSNISDAGLKKVVYKNLNLLHLQNGSNLSEKALINLIKENPFLIYVIAEVPNLKTKFFKEIKNTNIRNLHLPHPSTTLTNEGLSYVKDSKLVQLSAGNGLQITEKTILSLIQKPLLHLSLKTPPKISPCLINKLRANNIFLNKTI